MRKGEPLSLTKTARVAVVETAGPELVEDEPDAGVQAADGLVVFDELGAQLKDVADEGGGGANATHTAFAAIDDGPLGNENI